MLVDDRDRASGFRRLLEEYPNIAVVAEAETGEQAYRGYLEHQPDVLVVDISMPDTSGWR
jgi:two-component system invasion response regulator UvrY